jgi:hypothetical protein
MIWNDHDENGMYSRTGRVTAAIFPSCIGIMNQAGTRDEKLEKFRNLAQKHYTETSLVQKKNSKEANKAEKRKINENDFYFLNYKSDAGKNGNGGLRNMVFYLKVIISLFFKEHSHLTE